VRIVFSDASLSWTIHSEVATAGDAAALVEVAELVDNDRNAGVSAGAGGFAAANQAGISDSSAVRSAASSRRPSSDSSRNDAPERRAAFGRWERDECGRRIENPRKDS
jgi:hypothetical protein